MDVTDIEAGVDFVDVLQRAVGSCDVLLAVMGREWVTCTDKNGRRRLDDPNDFIRLEVGIALARNVRVIPVLVEGAAMPTASELPSDLEGLTRRQAVELRDARWNADVESLAAVLDRVLGPRRSGRIGAEPLAAREVVGARCDRARRRGRRRGDARSPWRSDAIWPRSSAYLRHGHSRRARPVSRPGRQVPLQQDPKPRRIQAPATAQPAPAPARPAPRRPRRRSPRQRLRRHRPARRRKRYQSNLRLRPRSLPTNPRTRNARRSRAARPDQTRDADKRRQWLARRPGCQRSG